nr:rhodanese-like domain-containing protein [Duganella sp. 1224]
MPSATRLLEAGYGARAAFAQAHIPGAGYLDTEDIEHAPRWLRAPDDELLSVLLAQGIRHDTIVILYGRNNLAAARAAHLMLYAGVTDVRLLDGGFGAWLAAGYPCASGPPPAIPAARADVIATAVAGTGGAELASAAAVAAFGRAFPAHPEYLIDTAGARALLAAPDGVLASIRTEAEHLGHISGYSYITARGDIPGARWAGAGDNGDVNSMSSYQLADGTTRPLRDIARRWRAAGITPERQVAFYCGTGWRAAMAFLYAYEMGWPRISVYDGGWCEWSVQLIQG